MDSTVSTEKNGQQVQLMMTCLCDAFYPEVAKASYLILERLGCRVDVPGDQTCCGQPAFNGGDWEASRKVARHTEKVFKRETPIVLPSGSCRSMLHHGNSLQFEEEPDLETIEGMGRRSWELCDFIVNGLGIETWPGRFPGKVALHRSCHTRGSTVYESAVKLLSSIEGLELTQVGEPEQCCGFGGTFSVSFPHISSQMGQLKTENLLADKPDYIAAVDMACMMHFGGMLDKQGETTPRLHMAQILLAAMDSKEPPLTQ